MRLYNSIQGRVARPIRPRKRKLGQMSTELINELKSLNKWQQIQMYVAAGCVNLKPVN